jgi:hypothetical protein
LVNLREYSRGTSLFGGGDSVKAIGKPIVRAVEPYSYGREYVACLVQSRIFMDNFST